MNLYDYGVPRTKEELLDGIIDKGMTNLCSKLWRKGHETLFSCSGLVSEHKHYYNWGGTYVLIKFNTFKDVLLFLKIKFFFGKRIVLLRKPTLSFGYYPVDMDEYMYEKSCQIYELSNYDLVNLDNYIESAIDIFTQKI